MVSFHVEPTSKCTLACPMCDRTWFFNKFKKREIHEINVDDLAKFVPNNSDVFLCGNNGDPIYHSKFHKLVEKLKTKNCNLLVTTNGSFRNTTWWLRLAKKLKSNDVIQFSIDGLENTNHLYRKNSDWKSIMNAIRILKSCNIRIVWKFIVFKHNQHQIKEAESLSKDLGFEKFILETSDRWLENVEMMPDEKYVDEYHLHQNKVLSDPTYSYEMLPRCLSDKKPNNLLYIDSNGDFYPCCWMGTHRYRYKFLFSPKNKQFNISNNSLEDILKQQKVKDFFESTKDFKTANNCCKMQCGVLNV